MGCFYVRDLREGVFFFFFGWEFQVSATDNQKKKNHLLGTFDWARQILWKTM